MSLTLLWALTLNGQEVIAFSTTAKAKAPVATTKLATTPDKESKTVVKQKVSLEATTSFVALNLHQAIIPAPVQSFAAPADEEMKSSGLAPPGNGFVAQLFPVTIQPNAP
ncbi:RNA methyltransferase [Pontibacter qinzhouensis]|uniref:RNA methyltransferase n=1 Tax=Pontibacter qinzhouensis TaxID=2603253 RepID=A0A5C8K3V2_9BACT|nr:RNA methyltransferase [Pontibacter qinzhouensis]TXK44944.1 RNA methyltransferase [Pontibacter qinzhouensis]